MAEDYHNLINFGFFDVEAAPGNPRGTVIPFMGKTAPSGYLVCDGTELLIEDYPKLAEFFEVQFGNSNHFGGDGETTFAVPDLRGEFLRGTGASVRTEGGSGAAVGAHQSGTIHVLYGQSGSYGYHVKVGYSEARNWDGHSASKGGLCTIGPNSGYFNTSTAFIPYYTARPTNTSVLWCIKT